MVFEINEGKDGSMVRPGRRKGVKKFLREWERKISLRARCPRVLRLFLPEIERERETSSRNVRNETIRQIRRFTVKSKERGRKEITAAMARVMVRTERRRRR